MSIVAEKTHNPAVDPVRFALWPLRDKAAQRRSPPRVEITMRQLCALLALLGFANHSIAATFAERVVIAKEIESQKEASDYFFGNFFPTVGPSMGGIMKMCLSRDGANQEKFTLVANVALSGEIINVDFEPKSNNTAACFAGEFSTLKAPPPPLCDGGVLPLVINMGVKP